MPRLTDDEISAMRERVLSSTKARCLCTVDVSGGSPDVEVEYTMHLQDDDETPCDCESCWVGAAGESGDLCVGDCLVVSWCTCPRGKKQQDQEIADLAEELLAARAALRRIAEPGCLGGYCQIVDNTSMLPLHQDRQYLTCEQVRAELAAGHLVYGETGYRILELEQMCGACEAKAALGDVNGG